jgi:hypothetical protein
VAIETRTYSGVPPGGFNSILYPRLLQLELEAAIADVGNALNDRTLNWIRRDGDDINFDFDQALDGPENTALDAIVSAHPAGLVEKRDSGTTGYNESRSPGVNDDITIGVEIGDVWVVNKTDVYVNLDNPAGAAKWSFMNQGGSSANESPGRTCLGSLLDYPGSAGNAGAGQIQYSRVWLVEGTVIDRLEVFLDTNGSPSREIRAAIYDQVDPLDEATDPNQRVAQTNAAPTGPLLDGGFIQLALTDAPTGGSGVPVNYTVADTGWHWLAFISDNTVAKFAVSAVFRANYLPVRRESGVGTTLPFNPGVA